MFCLFVFFREAEDDMNYVYIFYIYIYIDVFFSVDCCEIEAALLQYIDDGHNECYSPE